MPTKWCNSHLFCAVTTFGWVLSQFLNLAQFGLFLGSFSSNTDKELEIGGQVRKMPQKYIKRQQDPDNFLKFCYTLVGRHCQTDIEPYRAVLDSR